MPIEIFIKNSAFSLGVVIILLIFIFYFNKSSGLTNLESHLNIVINIFIIPYLIFIIISFFIDYNFLFTLDLLLIAIYLFFEFTIKRIIKEKIDENKMKWNLIRGLYFISFFIMLYSILHYCFILLTDAGLIVLILIIIIQLTFIIYLSKYEKQVFKQIKMRNTSI